MALFTSAALGKSYREAAVGFVHTHTHTCMHATLAHNQAYHVDTRAGVTLSNHAHEQAFPNAARARPSLIHARCDRKCHAVDDGGQALAALRAA